MRLIDADKIPYHKQLEAQGNGQYEDVEVAYKSEIDAVPSPKELYLMKHGKWEDITVATSSGKDIGLSRCSECGICGAFEMWNFCPNCGSEMRGEE